MIEVQTDVKNEQIDLDLKTEDQFDYDFSYDDFLLNDFPKQEDEDKPFICNECNKQYVNKKRFLRHLQTHEKASFHCTICSKGFHWQSNLNRHLATHNRCTMCLSYFESEALLFKHLNEHVDCVEIKTELNELYKCSECDMVYTKHRSLAMHMKKHKNIVGKKGYECDVCSKGFTLKSLLRRHMKLHNNARQFQCLKCNKTYSRQDQYNDHMKKHNGIKPYVCPHCSKGKFKLIF